ncbi:MAG: thiamine pyrophosphate-dependent enzyme [Silicimonas sp.]|nr:thiamine pyrophosphate-dependent enzyme [Silicimonas sp.]
MPKSIPVDPTTTRQPGRLRGVDIPLHAYDVPLASELAARGATALIEAYRHMLILRAFESGIASLKTRGSYGDLTYAYKGPAHLSIGQEAAAVGAAMALHPSDHIYGSHRSHSEFLAKGLAAIGATGDNGLISIMEGHGALLRAVEAHLPGDDLRARAENFLALGFLAEIFMRTTGFNGGMGGSMHAFFPPFGAYPNNAIVGASAGIATGAALWMKREAREAIAVSMVGDGATGCGPVWEAMNFAGQGQFRSLWDAKGGLPVLFFFTNNFYAMGGQTSGETMAWDRLARIGAGLNAEAFHAETVDGTNPLAVAGAVTRQRAHLLAGRGPALLDVECYRSTGHSTTDVNAYRDKAELAAWAELDPLVTFPAALVEAGVLAPEAPGAMKAVVEARMQAVFRAAADPEISPPVDVAGDPTLIGRKMFSHRTTPPEALAPAPLVAPERTRRLRQIGKKSRAGRDEGGATLSPLKAITLRDGLFEAMLHHMLRDPRLMIYGEECRDWGGAFGVTGGLAELFPHDRVFNAPISEAAIVATAIGAAIEGARPVVELMYADFIGRAGDEIFNQMAKWQAMSDGALSLPMVLRCSVGSKYGAQHSQDWTALTAHMPGLKVVYPATPYDAKGLMSEAITLDDPVVFFESQRLYDRVELFEAEVPAEAYRIEFGAPALRRAGSDVTILTIGPSLYPALEAADTLAADGVEAEVIDARTLVPFDYAPVIASLEKTGRLLVVSEACERGSFAMTLAGNLTRFAFGHLKAPPRVLGSPNWIVPGADMEESYFPQVGDILDAVRIDLMGAPDHRRAGVRNWDDQALARAGL